MSGGDARRTGVRSASGLPPPMETRASLAGTLHREMTFRRDPGLRVLRLLAVLCGAALFDLDFIWGQGMGLAGWLLRVAFNALLLGGIVISRGDIDRVSLDEAVIARAGGTREHFWQGGVAVLFTATRAVALRRRLIEGTIRGPLTEAPRAAVQLYHERHGAFFDRVRCVWPDGTSMHLRVRSRDMLRLSQSVEPAPRMHRSPLARTVDWVRAGTTYED